MAHYKSIQEAYEDGVKVGQKYFKEDHVEEGPIENVSGAKEFADALVEEVEEEELGPYSSGNSTEEEFERFDSGFKDGYVSKYRDYMEENGEEVEES